MRKEIKKVLNINRELVLSGKRRTTTSAVYEAGFLPGGRNGHITELYVDDCYEYEGVTWPNYRLVVKLSKVEQQILQRAGIC